MLMRTLILFVAIALLALGTDPLARQAPQVAPDPELLGSWTLESVEQRVGTAQSSRIANPRGLLVFDSAGHMLEVVARASGGRGAAPAPAPSTTPGLTNFASFSGFWGSYRLDSKQRTVTYRPEGAASPNLMGRELTRSFEVTANRVTFTSAPDEPHTQGVTRWTWERVPVVENLTPGYRQVIGFWQHVVEKRVNITTGAVLSETKRAPSVIVYTPSGYVGSIFRRSTVSGSRPPNQPRRKPPRRSGDTSDTMGPWPFTLKWCFTMCSPASTCRGRL
jgi:hypothetical protein